MPQRLWPQKDITASGISQTKEGTAVLIASRSSEYKKLLVAELQQQLAWAGIQQETVGVEELKNVDAGSYAAVVVINTCLAWGLDHDVEAFLDSEKSTGNILLLTTSADGSWRPAKRGGDLDAISCASVSANVDAVARNLVARIQRRLRAKIPPDADQSRKGAPLINSRPSSGFPGSQRSKKLGQVLDEEMKTKIKNKIRSALSPRHLPDDIRAIEEVPRTLNGKKLEVPVKKVLMGMPVESSVNRDSMSNPDSMDYFIQLAQELKSSTSG